MNVLAIGAHYDDVELGAGGTISKHVAAGDNVVIVVVTESDYNNHDGTILRSKEQARKEGEASAKILGVDNLLCLNFETKKVTYGVDLIEKLNGIIDSYNIDTIYTHWTNDVHQDHSAIASATLNAARHIPRVLMYRSNWYHTQEPFRESFFSDITNHIDAKIEALRAHETEYRRRGTEWVDFVRHQNRNSGIKMGIEYAESFEVIKWLT